MNACIPEIYQSGREIQGTWLVSNIGIHFLTYTLDQEQMNCTICLFVKYLMYPGGAAWFEQIG